MSDPNTITTLVAQWKAGDEKALETLLTMWDTANTNATLWKEAENSLRKAIFNNAWPSPTRGRNLLRIGHGMALVGDYKINYRIDQPGLENARDFIPLELFQQIIEYKPSVKAGPYRELAPEQQRLFHEFITETPGLPGLEIKPQAKIRWPK